MTSIYLITGFLGSGKTTFLQARLLDTTAKVGVLMNEFGKISMDTISLKKEGVTLIELTNGSIFCSCLKENFIKQLTHLVTLGLDEIYIESSGLSDPSDMGKVIQVIKSMSKPDSFVFKGTLCLVDGFFFKQELEKMVSVERQIRHSHHVLINKMDLINEDALAEIVTMIHEINPEVTITPVCFGIVDWQALNLEDFYIEDEETTNRVETKPKNIVIQFKHEPTLNQLKNFLEKMTSHFYRIKGFVCIDAIWYKVDLVNAQIDIKPYTVSDEAVKGSGYNELVCLTSMGLSSISHLAVMVEKELPMLYRLEM
jgi:G3E family GTPase